MRRDFSSTTPSPRTLTEMSHRNNGELPPRAEVEKFAEMLAHNARLDNPLPANTDFSAEEVEEVESQVRLKMFIYAKFFPTLCEDGSFRTPSFPSKGSVLHGLLCEASTRSCVEPAFSLSLHSAQSVLHPRRYSIFPEISSMHPIRRYTEFHRVLVRQWTSRLAAPFRPWAHCQPHLLHAAVVRYRNG